MAKRLALLLLLVVGWTVSASAQEFRAMWVDAFHAGLRNSTETSAVIAAARAAKCNAVLVQVRKRGDAYYLNGLEPLATQVNQANFDPLADLLARGHDTSGGKQRIEIHAWVVSFNIWGDVDTPPTQPTHPYNLHPDWLSQTSDGTTWDGANYLFDPGHPGVQQHTFDVCMDIVRRYDIDGIHFDYIRYPDSGSSSGSQPWGYNPVAVERFKAQTGATATPAMNHPAWLQWRRDQITALVRKVYLNTLMVKPHVRISASLIAYGNAPSSLSLGAWQSTEAYARVLQDWRGWMEEGILDLACPMIYGNGNTRFSGWSNYVKDRKYSRAAASGMGWYLNTVSNTIAQIDLARATSPNGNTGSGMIGYSYAVPNLNNATSQSSTWAQLVAGPYASSATVPAMPWKTNTTKGHLLGTALTASGDAALDGASVTLTGPANRTLITDGTGFFGAVDLPAGAYTLTLIQPGYEPVIRQVNVAGGTVAEQSLAVREKPFVVNSVLRNAGAGTLTITWNSIPGRSYRVESSPNLSEWSDVASGLGSSNGSTTYQWTIPANYGASAYLRVVRES